MEPPPVVKAFDVVEHLVTGLGARVEEPPVDQLGLQGGPEALHRGVVVAVPRPAHAGLHPVVV